jgi:phosphoglycolate phosphatase
MPLITFDLDGTLIDSRRDLADSANEMLAAYGAGPLPLDAVTAMVGNGARALVERALSAVGLDPSEPAALPAFLTIYDRRLLDHTRAYEGVAELLESLRTRAALAVLTNKPEAMSNRLLTALGLAPSIRWVIGGDAALPRKPDPSGLRHLVNLAASTPEATVMVGDSLVDVETARRAGTRLVVAGYGFGHLGGAIALTPGERLASTPTDLAGILDEFLGRRPGEGL